MKIKKIKTNAWVIFEGKQIPPGTILTAGKDIDEKQAESLLSMGKEVEEVKSSSGQPDLESPKQEKQDAPDKEK